jgi:hypothetical protein
MDMGLLYAGVVTCPLVHSKRSAASAVRSFEDELWQGLNETVFRAIPPKGEHSIAWILFHIARIENITMNLLVAGDPPQYSREKWEQRLHATIHLFLLETLEFYYPGQRNCKRTIRDSAVIYGEFSRFLMRK